MLQKPAVSGWQGFQKTAGKESINAGMGGYIMQMHTERHVHSVAPRHFSSAPKYLCGPGEGCTLQDCFCINGCGFNGIRGPYVWHVLAAPP